RIRKRAGSHGPRDRRGARRGRRRPDRRSARARAALARPREHDQVRRRAAPDELRLLLGRRGRRCRLAGRRALTARRARVLRPRPVRLRPLAAPTDAARRSAGVRYLRSFARFWWEFVVGDDWRVAAGLAAALGALALLVHAGVDAWWFLPPAVAAVLAASLRRATAPPPPSPPPPTPPQ